VMSSLLKGKTHIKRKCKAQREAEFSRKTRLLCMIS
jgi:hypothetical protein